MRYDAQHIPQKVTFQHFALLFVLGALSSGCGPSPEEVAQGDDPLAALTVASVSERYDGRYWRIQREQQPDLYEAAVRYCQDEEESGRVSSRPNCAPVLQVVAYIESMSQPAPKGKGYTGILEWDAASGAPAEAETVADENER